MTHPASHVFVAGGSSGINLGIAEAWARRGAKLAILSRSQDKIDTALARLRSAGAAQALGFAADVRDAGAVQQAFADAAAQLGPVDVLVSGAAILNITAAQSWVPTPGQLHVGAAKAGIDQLTRTLALEWGPHGVRVNAIAPGPVEGTEGMARLAPTPESVQAWTQAVPLRRFATTDDIARAALWLCGEEASHITGVVLSVDGGVCLGGSSAFARALQA